MLFYLHPTRNEALIASETSLTRWSLATNPATILAQLSTAPASVFDFVYDQGGPLQAWGGVTGTPDGLLFAYEQLYPQWPKGMDICTIEWHHWNDLSLARTTIVPHAICGIRSLANSPDGRWLVLENGGNISLLDWQTGALMSYHNTGGYALSGLAFDPTSTFVAGLSYTDGGGTLRLWRLEPAERFVPRPALQDWVSRKYLPQDYVSGNMILTPFHQELDRAGIKWQERDLADTTCTTAFSPDGHIVVFSPSNSGYSKCGVEMVAYEVISGKRLWCVRNEMESSGPWIFTPDGHALIVPLQNGDLLVYQVEDGALIQQLPSGLSEPVQALGFAHDGTTLWLATEKELVQYRSWTNALSKHYSIDNIRIGLISMR